MSTQLSDRRAGHAYRRSDPLIAILSLYSPRPHQSPKLLRRLAPMLSLLIPILCGLALSSKAFAQSNQAVYTDGLNNGWQNWSWASVNLSNNAPVHSGSASISLNAGPYQALYLHHAAFDSSIYTSLGFWINGGPPAGHTPSGHSKSKGRARRQ